MSLTRTMSVAIKLLVLLAAVFLILLTAVYFYLPAYIESRLIPQIAEDVGISDYAFDVRQVGLQGADLGILQIGRDQNPALLIRSIQLDYSLKGLYQRKIDRVGLSGVELFGEFKNGQFVLRGLDLKKTLERLQSRPPGKPSSAQAAPAVFVERLELRNAAAICETNNGIYRIPFEIDVVPEDQNYDIFHITAHLYPRDQKISAALKFEVNPQRIFLQFEAVDLNLAKFADVFQLIPELILAGTADLKGSANLQMTPFKIFAADTQLELRDAKIIYKILQLRTSSKVKDEKLPLRIKIIAKNNREWEVMGSGLSAVSPLPLDLSAIRCLINMKDGTIESTGDFSAVLGPSSGPSDPILSIMEPLPFEGQFSANFTQEGGWQFGLKNKPPEEAGVKWAQFQFDQFRITSKLPLFDISATAKGDTIKTTCTATVPELRFRSNSADASVSKTVFQGSADLDFGSKNNQQAVFNLQASNSEITLGSAKLKIPNSTLAAKFDLNKKSFGRMDGILRFADTSFTVPDLKARIAGVKGSLPLKWPAQGILKAGSISIATLRYQNLDLGSISGMVQQTASGISFNGDHINNLIPNLSLKLSGNSKLFSSVNQEPVAHFEISSPGVRSEIDLGKFIPSARGVNLEGRFSLNGKVAIGRKGVSALLKSKLQDGKLLWGEKKIAVEGIQADLFLPDLPNVRSAPQQKLSFEKAGLGDIEINRGQIDFQLESLQSFFIEKIRFKWCDGSVDTQAMRISPAKEDYSLVLFCDRLNLAKVLGQFGAANAEGRGTVNGKIPLRYKQGRLSFDDGFLFSTPGEGGKIRVTGTEILTAGVPPNTPQYIQMELAREALKDYDYNWAKLNITSAGEDLLIGMQLDGKPANPLPFVYKKELGGFAKIEAGVAGSVFQGIHLDVNFRLPLNKILYYKDIINMIE